MKNKFTLLVFALVMTTSSLSFAKGESHFLAHLTKIISTPKVQVQKAPQKDDYISGEVMEGMTSTVDGEAGNGVPRTDCCYLNTQDWETIEGEPMDVCECPSGCTSGC